MQKLLLKTTENPSLLVLLIRKVCIGSAERRHLRLAEGLSGGAEGSLDVSCRIQNRIKGVRVGDLDAVEVRELVLVLVLDVRGRRRDSGAAAGCGGL